MRDTQSDPKSTNGKHTKAAIRVIIGVEKKPRQERRRVLIRRGLVHDAHNMLQDITALDPLLQSYGKDTRT
jgi:hypothetical protein